MPSKSHEKGIDEFLIKVLPTIRQKRNAGIVNARCDHASHDIRCDAYNTLGIIQHIQCDRKTQTYNHITHTT